MTDAKPHYPPVETTAPHASPPVAEKTHGIEVSHGKIFIVGAGLLETTAYRRLESWEVQQLTHVFPYLFSDMELEYEHAIETDE